MDDSYKEVRSKLNEKLDGAEVKERESFSYVSGHYVITKLNEILGQGNWSYDTLEMKLAYQGSSDKMGQTKYSVHYIAHVRLRGRIGAQEFSFSDYGYGDSLGQAHPGKGHEKAVKEAVTDGIKRCAKNLGPVMGLALYEKEQTDVIDRTESAASNQTKPDVSQEPKHSGSSILDQLKAAANKIVIEEKKMTKEQFTKQYLNGKSLNSLSLGDASVVFFKLGIDYPFVKDLLQ